MTAPRQERKRLHLGAALGAFGAALFGAALVGAGMGAVPGTIGAATTERIVTDSHTGLAISGFDPVAYFLDAAPIMGRPEWEFRYAGAIWRFANEGNRAAFAADPEAFMPRFGGYDPTSIARGANSPGHPEVWLVVEDRLYLFYEPGTRDSFSADPDGVLDSAEYRWPKVLHTLAR